MKHQAVFSSKDRSKEIFKCRQLQSLFGALRINKSSNYVSTSVLCRHCFEKA